MSAPVRGVVVCWKRFARTMVYTYAEIATRRLTLPANQKHLSKYQADRAKTRCGAPYDRAEDRFSRFFPQCAVIGREIRAALDMPRSFRTVCKIFAPRSGLNGINGLRGAEIRCKKARPRPFATSNPAAKRWLMAPCREAASPLPMPPVKLAPILRSHPLALRPRPGQRLMRSSSTWSSWRPAGNAVSSLR